MKVITGIIWILIALFAVSFFYPDSVIAPFATKNPATKKSNIPVCAQEVMQCSDGSYVGRTGPECAFALCPIISATTSEVTLSLNETMDASGIRITFNSFVADNRCPIDVRCIDAGAVVVNVTITDGKEMITRNFSSNEDPFLFVGKRISIVDALPKPVSTLPIKVANYHVTFQIK